MKKKLLSFAENLISKEQMSQIRGGYGEAPRWWKCCWVNTDNCSECAYVNKPSCVSGAEARTC
jgi:natural product precursor